MNRHTQKDQLAMSLWILPPAVFLFGMWVMAQAGMII